MIAKEAQRWRDRLIEKGRKEGFKEGFKKGFQEGLKLGREKGRKENQRDISQSIIDALAERFGPLPAALTTAIKAMKDASKLLDVFSLSAEATSLDDFSRRLQTV